MQGRLAKTLMHVIDSVLLVSALALPWVLRLNPVQIPWLLAKITGLLAYIGLGMLALKSSGHVRVAASIGATLAFGYIVSVITEIESWPWIFRLPRNGAA